MSGQYPKSYLSLFYGAITVVAIFIVVFFGIRLAAQRNIPSIGDEGIQTSQIINNLYTVKAGDSLWSIAETQYKDGYRWVEIARLNNLSNTEEIEVGMKLKLPDITASVSQKSQEVLEPTTVAAKTPVDTKTSSQAKITGNTYTVVKGDNLWNIAVRAYGDGFKWVGIAKANKLVNPDLIHAGNKFIIPR